MKICVRCNQKKKEELFYKDKNSQDNLKASCKDCIKIYRKEYNNLNRDKNNLYSALYKLKNPNQNKLYYIENKHKIIKNIINKRKNDPNLKIISNLRNRIYKCVINKSNSSIKLLGCSIEEFKIWLESQFINGMNWKNYGKVWEIDHIKPCASFDLTDESQQKECFHYTNLMPRFKTTKIAESFGSNQIGNRNKSDKMI